jgi:hypothetical protein
MLSPVLFDVRFIVYLLKEIAKISKIKSLRLLPVAVSCGTLRSKGGTGEAGCSSSLLLSLPALTPPLLLLLARLANSEASDDVEEHAEGQHERASSSSASLTPELLLRP